MRTVSYKRSNNAILKCVRGQKHCHDAGRSRLLQLESKVAADVKGLIACKMWYILYSR